MAIQKELQISTGNTGSYWRVKDVKILNGSDLVCATLELWKDQATRGAEGKAPMAKPVYTLDIGNLEGDIVSKCYEAIKLLEQFQGATDV